jgi:imidazolonepropionase
MDKLFVNIAQLYLAGDLPNRPLQGSEMARIAAIPNTWLRLRDGKIEDFGSMENVPESSGKHIDVKGGNIYPAWCDSHTHIVFAASREAEFVMRIKGKSYEEIAAEGGGILNSAGRLAETDEEKLFEDASRRVEEVMSCGTGMLEIKSGYGLSYEAELKMLRVIRRLKEAYPLLPIRSTFLGAHALPAKYKENRQAYIDLVIEQLLPEVADEGLADYVDVFCEKGFFTNEETDRILEAGDKYGLKAKIHANQLDFSGGVQTGVRNKAISVDHLERVGEAEIEALKQGNTLPTLLPSASFFLNEPYAPARKIIDSGLPVVIASDFNPGSTPSGNMQFVIALACIKMRMLPEEAINAATINGAHALEWGAEAGSISRGKWANLIVTDANRTPAFIPYAFGSRHVRELWLKGERVV